MTKQVLDENKVYAVLKSLLPEKNDFSKSDYKEELEELIFFNIRTVNDLRALIKKHLKRLIEIDEEPIDPYHQKLWAEELGEEAVQDRLRNKYWFAYPGLLRIALELEFGEKYIEFANKRDSL